MRLSLALVLFFLPVLFVSAHATGISYEERKDGYKIDIGHEEFMMADTATRFDFALIKENSTTTDDLYTDVWVTLTQDKKIIFAGGISKPVFGATGFSTVFPHEGTYTVSARFQKNGEAVVKSEFPVTISPVPVAAADSSTLKINSTVVAVATTGLILGFGIGFFIGNKRKSNKK